jgi:hypothetical protein
VGVFGYHGGTAMKPDYNRIPRHTLKSLEAWIATGRHLDDDDEAEAFGLAIVMKRPRGGHSARR